MSSYLIAIRERLHDESSYEKYKNAAVPTLESLGAQTRVADGPFRVLEGAAADGVYLIEFDSFDQAESWYESGEYQEAKRFRDGAVDYRIILVEGV